MGNYSGDITPVAIRRRYGLTWEEIVDVVATNTLSRFHRTPRQLIHYKSHFARVQEKYGSIQTYILQEQLGWDLSHTDNEKRMITRNRQKRTRRPVDVIKWDECPHSHYLEDNNVLEITSNSSSSSRDSGVSRIEGMLDLTERCEDEIYALLEDGELGDEWKVIETPYPYAIPPDCKHLVIWSKVPILHPCVIPSEIPRNIRQLAWEHIQSRGLSGIVHSRQPNLSNLKEGYFDGILLDRLQVTEEEEIQIRKAIWLAGRYIRNLVERLWGDEFETVWFANPPSLQSVPDLAHFHCMIRPRS